MNTLSQSLTRIAKLWRVFALTQQRAVLTNALSGFAVLLAAYIIAVFSGGPSGSFNFHEVLFGLFFLLVGIVAGSQAFSAMHKQDRSYAYLTLPASHLEKTVDKLLLSTVGYGIAVLAGYFLFSAAALGIGELIAGRSYPLFNPFERWVWEIVGGYIVIHSIFLFGAAYFKNRHFIKTLLGIAAVFLLLAGIASLATWVFFNDIFQAMRAGGFDPSQSITIEQAERFQSLLETVQSVVDFIATWLLAPFFWILTWLRLREAEVADAV